jgi:hypothetical protein
MTPYDGLYTAALASAHQASGDAARSVSMLYGLVQQQAALLSYADGFQILAVGTFAVIPLVLLLKNVEKGSASAPVH